VATDLDTGLENRDAVITVKVFPAMIVKVSKDQATIDETITI
jgi:hypothetical protein